MRRLLPLLLSVLLLAGCASPAAPEEEGAKRYEATLAYSLAPVFLDFMGFLASALKCCPSI